MKKMVVSLSAALCAVLIVISVTACSLNTGIEGTYKFSSIETYSNLYSSPVTAGPGGSYYGMYVPYDYYTLVMNGDNTWTLKKNDNNDYVTTTGTWEEISGKYYMHGTGGEEYTATLNGNELALIIEDKSAYGVIFTVTVYLKK